MTDVLDRRALDALMAMVGHDPEFVDDLVDAYLSDAPLQAAAMRAALDAGDAEGLVRPAHTLKSTTLSLGGLRVAEIARAIEESGRAGRLEGVQELLADLEAASRDLADELGRARAQRWVTG